MVKSYSKPCVAVKKWLVQKIWDSTSVYHPIYVIWTTQNTLSKAKKISRTEDYNSHNTERLDVTGMQDLLMKLTFMPAIKRGENIAAEE